MTKHSIKDVLLAEVVCHSLLCLYHSVAYAEGYMPAEKRTQVLLKHYKCSFNKTKYKPIKSDIRGLIHFGRKNPKYFEVKVNEINQLAVKRALATSERSDMAQFTKLLHKLNSECEVYELPQEESLPKSLFMYVNQQSIEAAFSVNGSLIEPIQIVVPENKWDILTHLAGDSGWNLNYDREYKDKHIVGMLVKALS